MTKEEFFNNKRIMSTFGSISEAEEFYRCCYAERYVPKEGDFVSTKYNEVEAVAIVANVEKCSTTFMEIKCYAIIRTDEPGDDVLYNGFYTCPEIREAKEYEREQLIDALHEDGKDWDEVKKKIVKYTKGE